MLACSHLVLASADVPRIAAFFRAAFDLPPRFENAQFAEFVLPSRFRIAFFLPVGGSALLFRAAAPRDGGAIGVTVADVDACHGRITALAGQHAIELSGPPKDHPWGERSFLLTDPDGNRWEVAQSPSPDGMLRDR
ncbi:MAG: VOC family protein [Thermoanaerobaculia bacterium]|nr:MAG: VOC family protein [Thermoanaerobaculia bacterium]MBZ0100841.1 VOC family protein [Thermoanaerobaculia bacterium]